MPRTSPYRIELTDDERTRLGTVARSYTLVYRDVMSAKIVLLAAEGMPNEKIAARLDTSRQVVSKWRKRFYDQRMAGLSDRLRSGRPRTFPPELVMEIKALACELPGKCIEHEYERKGSLAYLAAWDVHRAKLFGRCELSTGIEPFGRLVEQVMGAEPYSSAERVFWIVDNGSSHRGQASVDQLQGAFSNLVLIHLPVHAS